MKVRWGHWCVVVWAGAAAAASAATPAGVDACKALAHAWSQGEESRVFALRVLAEDTPAELIGVHWPDDPDGPVANAMVEGTLTLPGGATVSALKVITGGTCASDETHLARQTSHGWEILTRIRGIDDDTRWDFWGTGGQLMRIGGALYQAFGQSGTGSWAGRLDVLYRLEGWDWVRTCTFEPTPGQWKLRGDHPVCAAIRAGRFDVVPREPAVEESGDLVELSGVDAGAPSERLRLHGYASGAGCGAQLSWVDVEREFAGRSREQVLHDGAPRTMAIMSPGSARDALTLDSIAQLIDHHNGGRGADHRPFPDVAVTWLEVVRAAGYTALMLPVAESKPGEPDDVRVLLNGPAGPQQVCQGHLQPGARVKQVFQ